MSTNPLSRSDIPVEFTWDLSILYKTEADWEQEFALVPARIKEFDVFRDKLAESATALRTILEKEDALNRLLEKLFTYAHLRSDEDKANTHYQGLLDRITALFHDCAAQLAWMQPEIMSIPENIMCSFLENDELAFYRFSLEQLLRYKPHTLSANEEKIMAMAAEALSVPYKAFSMLCNADIRFPEVTDENNNKVEMTDGLYSKFLQNYNRQVRKDAFKAMYRTYESFINTLSSLLDGAIKANIFNARVRNFPSAIEASLFKDNIHPDVYSNLINVVNNNLPAFHQYIALRKKILGIEELDMFDMYTPLVADFNLEIPWEQARDWVITSIKPLGSEYQDIARKAFSERWIDVLECRGKRSGAYSDGCYDSLPYLLLNYNSTLNSVFTLAHELGHSMHSYLSRSAQQYRYADYPILLAEVASTTNELLLLDYLLKVTTDIEMKKYLLNYYCDGVKGTVYRQVQFAEYEMNIYGKVEKGIPLTVEELNSSYYELNKKYYGPEVKADADIRLEWGRIPHFYYNFYVYKYATGFSAATQFAESILSGKQEKVESYLNVLKAGCSDEPLNILKKAGVDLAKPESIVSCLVKFEKSVEELEKMLPQQ